MPADRTADAAASRFELTSAQPVWRDAAVRPPRVAVVVFGGDAESPDLWSGTPANLVAGLRAAGAEPVAIPTRLPAALRVPLGAGRRVSPQAPAVWGRTPPLVALATRVVQRRLDATPELDAAIVMTTEAHAVRPSVPWATFDDMTIVQARRSPHSEINWYPRAATARWAERQAAACRAASVCCATNAWAAESIVDDLGVDPARVRVVGLGAKARPEIPAARDWSQPRFLFLGFDWSRKNGDAVVRAFRRVRAERPLARLDVVGGHPPLDEQGVTGHGPLRLEDPAAQRAVAELFARTTCLVLPSWLEPSALVHLEAGALGIPSIGTTVGGVATLIGPGGLLVDPAEEDALPAAMLRLADGEEALRLGQLAAAHARRFTWPSVADRILNALL